MSPTAEPRYTLTELADLANVSPRTIRYYISQGLLPGPGTVGPGAKYDDTDLARLRVVKRLQLDHLPLAEIRGRLADMDDDEVAQLDQAPPPPVDSALDYLRRIRAPHPIAERPAMYRMSKLLPTEPEPQPAAAAPAPAPAPAPDIRLERSQWDRIELAPDIELHIRRPLARSTAKRVDRLISIARDLLEEDPS